jgi:chorismate-pyruvate lyase
MWEDRRAAGQSGLYMNTVAFRRPPRTPAVIRTPTADSLYALFPGSADGPRCTPVPGDHVPEPYHSLLVHTHHMTVTVERHYGGPVDVRVLETALDGHEYARKILLELRGTGQVVQFGIVQIDLDLLSEPVRTKIVEGKTPLGRVLIEHDVLRHIQPAGYLKVEPCRTMCEWFGLTEPVTTYGRLGVIHTDGKPAIEVLEVLAPIVESATG